MFFNFYFFLIYVLISFFFIFSGSPPDTRPQELATRLLFMFAPLSRMIGYHKYQYTMPEEGGQDPLSHSGEVHRPFAQAAIMICCTLLGGAVGGSLSLVIDGTINAVGTSSEDIQVDHLGIEMARKEAKLKEEQKEREKEGVLQEVRDERVSVEGESESGGVNGVGVGGGGGVKEVGETAEPLTRDLSVSNPEGGSAKSEASPLTRVASEEGAALLRRDSSGLSKKKVFCRLCEEKVLAELLMEHNKYCKLIFATCESNSKLTEEEKLKQLLDIIAEEAKGLDDGKNSSEKIRSLKEALDSMVRIIK